ncbi:HAD-IC family P-type ATPase [Microbacterium sp. CH-015]|uniref:HAD-IC family P-type ATPase n=1 Tax=Microbacterium sp. CH-015 TaxID=3406734 RepID=UPI003C789D7A
MTSSGVQVGPAIGLDAAAVAARVADGRVNAYRADASRSAWSIVRANVFTLFNAIVFACFGILFVIGRWQDALFGFAAIGNAVIGSFQEFRAKRALDRLALLNAAQARVRRDGAEVEIPPGEVVEDDILVLRAGDQIPADAEVVTARGLQVDESMLTGESDAVDKLPGSEVLSGSIVVAGEGAARVTKVGADSYANRFADEAKKFSLMRSELRSSIDRVLRWVSFAIAPVGILVLNAQMQVMGGWGAAFSSGRWTDAVTAAIASITAMIPLGLVLMTSIAFAVGAAKLASQQVLVNELPAVEGLARVDLICLDKTGTLTVGDIAFDAAHELPAAGGAVDAASGWRDALAWYGAAPDANATARVLADAFPDADRLQATATIPFSSARKWSAVSEASGTWVMGAPEMVFGDAATDDTGDFGRRVTELAATGRRTLVLAHAPASLIPAEAEAETLPAGLVPVVLLTFREQIRPDAAQTLEYFRQQGVSIRIISGDNPRTVAAIAREVGLDVAEGYDARTLPTDEAELGKILDAHEVFGRVTPEQKKGMVTALQARGHTVAMTGDGVNDALAIKTADIGIAMNSGAAATKAVARLVLLDGQFSHLPAVVAQGRQVIANIERVSMLFLTKTVYATTLAVVFGALLLEFPFLPRQLSITDGLTIGIPAFFLALMPNARRYVPGFLPRSLSFAVPAGLIIATGLTTYSLLARSLEVPQPQLRTGTTIILAIVGIWVLAVLSRPLNRYKVLIVGAMFVGLVIIFTVPLSTAFFDLRDPGEDAAVLLTLVAIPMIAAIEVVRFFHRRFLTRALAAAGLDSAAAPAPTPPAITVAAVLAYVAALAATGLGLIVLLARYDVPDDDVLRVSLLGAGIALFGLMILAAAAGMRRGSGLLRLLVSVYLVIVVGLTVLVLADSRLSNLWATGVAVIGVVAIVLPWLPPASRFFSRLRDSSMTA